MSKEILCKSPYRKIPTLIHKVPNDQLSSFLKGLFDAEGSVTGHKVCLTSTSHDIINVVQMFLLRFGIISHVYDYKNTRSDRKAYQLVIYHPSSIKKFKKDIGFSSELKTKKLNELLSSIGNACAERMDLIPLSGETILRIAKELRLNKSDLRKLNIIYYHCVKGHKTSRTKALYIIEKFKKIRDKKDLTLSELDY